VAQPVFMGSKVLPGTQLAPREGETASACTNNSFENPTLKAELQVDKHDGVGTLEIEESVEPETRRQKDSPSKVEDEEDYDDYEEDHGEFLPEAQPRHARSEVDAAAANIRQNALHVYGLDFLKTAHMDEIFSQFDHKCIEWINDSSANIIFSEAASAKRALDALSFPKVGDEPWRRTPDILVSEDMPPIFLQMRHATAGDAKRSKKSMPTMTGQHSRVPRKPDARSRMNGRQQVQMLMDPTGSTLQTRRPNLPLTQEEREKRLKRSKRFSDWLTAVAPSNATAAVSSDVRAGEHTGSEGCGEAASTIEATEEELSKRRKRSARFGKEIQPALTKITLA